MRQIDGPAKPRPLVRGTFVALADGAHDAEQRILLGERLDVDRLRALLVEHVARQKPFRLVFDELARVAEAVVPLDRARGVVNAVERDVLQVAGGHAEPARRVVGRLVVAVAVSLFDLSRAELRALRVLLQGRVVEQLVVDLADRERPEVFQLLDDVNDRAQKLHPLLADHVDDFRAVDCPCTRARRSD